MATSAATAASCSCGPPTNAWVSRRFEAAFAKLGCAVLVELGTHAPLAAAISAPDLAGSQVALGAQLLGRLPAESLLLGDRLYGNGAFLGRLSADAPAGGGQAFLLRVSQTPRPTPLKRRGDGSALVEVRLGRQETKGPGDRTLIVREMRGRVRRPGGAWSEVRLWTSLLDAKAHPALELLGLYARRWEQELAYRELKVDPCAPAATRPWPAMRLADDTHPGGREGLLNLFDERRVRDGEPAFGRGRRGNGGQRAAFDLGSSAVKD